ncbi:sensor histidine kinase [Aeromicrobium sp. CTD01-1L150]|uniref:sensor histidine kinase n=1 Tax=Aeromicrobium sp. CTD01-1L150 TaxID=3341830 RepID=UPI0035C02113
MSETPFDDVDPQQAPGRSGRDVPEGDPWERYGWIMGAIWLVFLAFPIVSSVQAETTWGWRVASVTSIVLFAAVYVQSFMRLDTFETWKQVHRFGMRRLAILLVLCAVPAVVIEAAALGMLPFIAAFAMFGLRLPVALAVGGATLLAAVLVPAAIGMYGELWFFGLIVGLVLVTTGLVRVLDERGAEHRELSRQMDIVSERERVARDVHDVLGHSLTVVTVKSELARRLIDDDPERAKIELDDIHSLSRTALAEVRATVAGLRVARIEDELKAASVALCGAGIDADLPDDHSVVDPRHRIIVAWVLREAVTNVVRHSRAGRCEVRLQSAGIVVQDDGIGPGDHADGNGLRGLRERVQASGGTLLVEERPEGSGTRLEVSL